ncbi:MAG: YraN family protein [Candidatus Zixiibacteriota bacterium]|jgi:putative endonuclease
MTRDGRSEAARRRELGRAGEDAAADFLRERGFRVVARNYHTTFGEIDIVAEKNGVLVFAEVKTGRAGSAVDPRAAFTSRKVARLYRAAMGFLERERPGEDVDLRFDFLAVSRRGDDFDVEHYEAVSPGDYGVG